MDIVITLSIVTFVIIMVIFNVVSAGGAVVSICVVNGVAGIVVAVCLVTCCIFVICVVAGVVDMAVMSVAGISALVIDDVIVTAVLVITIGFTGAVIA